ncbi:MAG: peptidoglycan-associated lipoprotein Pal [Deltaproteobacteria bacterium]|nr:peptidoglycan-associated lipoprotein Pal [Deltaproteobacteria bacterium]
MNRSRRGAPTWIVLGTLVLAMAAFGTTGCKKKGPKGGVSGSGGQVTGGDDGAGARAGAINEAQSQLQTVYFEYDSSDIRSDAQGTLRQNADVIGRYADVRVQIQGHTDERGSEEYNLALGDRRARAIMDYLVNLGVNPARLNTITFGEERPVDPGHDEAAYARNRRGEFVAE